MKFLIFLSMIMAVSAFDCDYYADNSDWLPINYAVSAQCICSSPYLDYAEASCVRTTLQDLHDDAFPDEIREESRQMLNDYRYGWIDWTQYAEWADFTFTDKIISIHYQAYSECDCTGEPAADFFWHEIVLTESVMPCTILQESQQEFSKCIVEY